MIRSVKLNELGKPAEVIALSGTADYFYYWLD